MSDNSFDSENLSGGSNEDDRETKNQTGKEKSKNKSEEKKEKPKTINLDLINSISQTLVTILEENKKSNNYKDIIKTQSKMVFSANNVPNISIKDYLIRIQTYSEIEKSTLILSLILIDHTCKKSGLILTYHNIHRLLFGAIIISIKYNEDSYYDNKFYSEIAGVKLKELKSIEYCFLELNDFNVYIGYNEYEQYRKYLESYQEISNEKD